MRQSATYIVSLNANDTQPNKNAHQVFSLAKKNPLNLNRSSEAKRKKWAEFWLNDVMMMGVQKGVVRK